MNPKSKYSVNSLDEVVRCQKPEEMEHIVNPTVQVIQSRNFETVMVTQCHIKVTRVIAHCGKGHRSSLVKGAMKVFTYALGSAACRKAHRRIYIEIEDK